MAATRQDRSLIRIRSRLRQWLRFESVRRNIPMYRLVEVLAMESEQLHAVRRARRLSKGVAGKFASDVDRALEEEPAPWEHELYDEEHDYGMGRFKGGK